MQKNKIIVIISLLLFFASWQLTDVFAKSRVLTHHKTIGYNVKYNSDEIVNIRIFSQLKVQSLTFSADAGVYSVWANGVEIVSTEKFPLIKFSYVNDSVEVKTFENVIGRYKKIKVSSPNFVKSFRLKLILPDRKPRF